VKKYAAEFIGTFALVFAGTGAIVVNEVSHGAITQVGIALTFGLIVLVMIYTLGDISGAHINPPVTIGFWLSRRMPGPGSVAIHCKPMCGLCDSRGLNGRAGKRNHGRARARCGGGRHRLPLRAGTRLLLLRGIQSVAVTRFCERARRWRRIFQRGRRFAYEYPYR
jgi:hypothetical protein